MSFDLELDHRAILACHLQVDVLIVLRLYSLLEKGKEKNLQDDGLLPTMIQ